jgi:hypothetical protein
MSLNCDAPVIISHCGWTITVDKPTAPEFKFLFKITINGISIKGETLMLEFTKPEQFATFAVEILDTLGRPAQIDGEIVVANTNEAGASVEFDQTLRTGTITALTGEGPGQVTFTCDADLGEGVKNIIGILDFVTNYSGAVVIQVTPGLVQEPPISV